MWPNPLPNLWDSVQNESVKFLVHKVKKSNIKVTKIESLYFVVS
jgi:hypothetical protein